jgi:hypothetical protein
VGIRVLWHAFWIFLQRAFADRSTVVYKLARASGELATAIPETGRTIVGAGVSTCAPIVGLAR